MAWHGKRFGVCTSELSKLIYVDLIDSAPVPSEKRLSPRPRGTRGRREASPAEVPAGEAPSERPASALPNRSRGNAGRAALAYPRCPFGERQASGSLKPGGGGRRHDLATKEEEGSSLRPPS